MRKIEIKPMELKKYEIIKETIKGRESKLSASVKLGVTIRTINRLITKYHREGIDGFIHKNRGKSNFNKISYETKKMIIDLYETDYYNFNFNHFLDRLKIDKKINISYNALYNLLKENFFLSPKAQRKTKNE